MRTCIDGQGLCLMIIVEVTRFQSSVRFRRGIENEEAESLSKSRKSKNLQCLLRDLSTDGSSLLQSVTRFLSLPISSEITIVHHQYSTVR
uniref:Proteasome activator Blm10 mid region domain-containing protein n=1 Tax=Parascaris univalens TaxID=6257 RepID=A0A914ZZZ1_PARUN